MMKRFFIPVFSCCAAVLTLFGEPASTVDPSPPPNIIVFLVDDMGWFDTSLPFYYVGGEAVNPAHEYDFYGEPRSIRMNSFYRTPNMERLASQGMKFTRGYANPVCSPTRVSLMTGQSAARHRVTSYLNRRGADTGKGASVEDWRMKGLDASFEDILLPKLLNEDGYETIYAGKGHMAIPGGLGAMPESMGFDVVIGQPVGGSPASFVPPYGGENGEPYPALEDYEDSDVYLTEALTREAGKAVEEAVRSDTPFFLYMSHYAVHWPWATDPRFADNYPTMHEGAFLDYATMIEGMDKSLGDLMNLVEALGVADNTLILFASDNGSANPLGQPVLRETKGSLYEGGVRVPMIAAWAKSAPESPSQKNNPIQAGGRTGSMAHVRDFYTTVLDAAGLSVDRPATDSASLWPTLADPRVSSRDTLGIHFPHGRGDADDAGTVWTSGDWKLIHRYLPEQYELFHLPTDIQEEHDLSEALPDKVAELREEMEAWLEKTDAATVVFAK